MNDAAVREIWKALAGLDRRIGDLEDHVVSLEGRIRARLKEEADAARQ